MEKGLPAALVQVPWQKVGHGDGAAGNTHVLLEESQTPPVSPPSCPCPGPRLDLRTHAPSEPQAQGRPSDPDRDPGRPPPSQRPRDRPSSQRALRTREPPAQPHSSYLDDSIRVGSEIPQPLQIRLPLPVPPPVSLCQGRRGGAPLVPAARQAVPGSGGWGRRRGNQPCSANGYPHRTTRHLRQPSSRSATPVPAHTCTRANTHTQAHTSDPTQRHGNPTGRHKR